MKLGNLSIEGKTFLSPMAGITDITFRMLAKRLGASMVYSEMISADGISRGNAKTERYMEFHESERPIGFQLFGCDPYVMGEAARRASALKPDLIDINFGCPVHKVTKKNGGSSLLRDLKLFAQIIKSVIKGSAVPVTVKIRSGWDQNSINAPEAARIAEDLGAVALTIHPRTRQQFFEGKADWSVIAKVKQAVKIPVVGNGDINSPEDAQRMLEETGCDAIMIARAALGNPWIMGRIHHYLETGQKIPEASVSEKAAVCLEHAEKLCARIGEHFGMKEMRKHIAWYIKGFPKASELRQKINTLETLAQLRGVLLPYLQPTRFVSDAA
jgi:tRNA-dihydrouridine synthase B